MKKLITAILAVSMLAACLSGCGTEKTAGNLFNEEVYKSSGLDFGGLEMPLSENGEKVTWAVTSDVTTLNDSYVVKKIRELTGVDLQLDILSPSSAEEKTKILIASKSMDDIMTIHDPALAYDLASQGALACVEEYIDDIPNFKSIFVDREDTTRIFKSYPMADGRLYGFYGYDWSRDVNINAMMYRKDIFDKLGIGMWNSPETFYEALKKLKEAYPDSIPFAVKTNVDFFSNLSESWGIKAFKPYYDENSGVWKYSDTEESYREMLDYVKKLYDEGLLDSEFATRTQADWTSLMTGKNKSFVTLDWIGRMDMFKEQMKSEIPEYDLRFANPVGPTQQMTELPQLCWARYVKKSDEDHERLVFKLLDTILSPGGKQLITMGIEGETFELDENGMAVHPEFEGRNPQMNELIEKYGMFIEGMYLSFDRRSSYFKFTEREQEAQDFAKDKSHMAPMDPELPFNTEENEEINSILPDLETAAKEFAVNYVVAGKSTDADWQAWKEKTKNLKVERLIEIYNKVQKRYDAE